MSDENYLTITSDAGGLSPLLLPAYYEPQVQNAAQPLLDRWGLKDTPSVVWLALGAFLVWYFWGRR